MAAYNAGNASKVAMEAPIEQGCEVEQKPNSGEKLKPRSGDKFEPRLGVVVNLLDQKLWNHNPDFLSYTLSKAALETAKAIADDMRPDPQPTQEPPFAG